MARLRGEGDLYIYERLENMQDLNAFTGKFQYRMIDQIWEAR